MKKLVDGLEIQKKFDDGSDGEIWLDKVYNTLEKYNIDSAYNKNYLVLLNNKKEWVFNVNEMLEWSASKNLASIYLSDNNTIIIENDRLDTLEILREISDSELEKILDGE